MVSEEEAPPLGSTCQWLGGFLNYHPELSSKFASGLDRRRAHSCKPEPIRESWNRSKVMEDMFGALRLVSCQHSFVKFMVRAKVGLTTREATRRVEDVEL